jgi:hypothetical protein
MGTMSKGLIAKRILQAMAIVIGFAGVFLALTGLLTGVFCVQWKDAFTIIEFFTVIVMAALVLLGLGMIVVAYQAIYDFNQAVVKNVVALLVFILWERLFFLSRPLLDAAIDSRETSQESLLFILSIIIATQVYRVTSRNLIKLTENETFAQ